MAGEMYHSRYKENENVTFNFSEIIMLNLKWLNYFGVVLQSNGTFSYLAFWRTAFFVGKVLQNLFFLVLENDYSFY